MGKRLNWIAAFAGSTAIMAGVMPASSQDADGGYSMTFGISSTLRTNDNLSFETPSAGRSTLWDNRLTFGLASETPSTNLSLDLGATVRGAWLPGQSFEGAIGEPSATLSYGLESTNSTLGARLHYSEVDLDFEDPLSYLDDEISDDDLILSAGSRTRWGGRVNFETGQNNPLGFGASAGYDSTEYSGADPELFDSERTDAEIFARMLFSPVAEGRIVLSWDEYVADDVDQTARTTRGVRGEVEYEIDAITRLEASLGYTDIEETEFAVLTIAEEGLVGSVALSRDFPLGTLTAQVSTEVTTAGRRDRAQIGGSMDMPSGSLAAELGVTRTAGGDGNVFGGLDYTRELASGDFTASFNRNYATDLDGDDTRTTLLELGYNRDLTRDVSVEIGFNYAEVFDVASSDLTEIKGLSASYNRSLTPDWNLSTGYTYRHRSETGELDTESNEFFLTLEREFTIR